MDELAYQQFCTLDKTHWWLNGRRNIFFHLLDTFLPVKKGLRVMDVGCGFGGMLPGLSRYGHAMGLEIDLDSARGCRKRGFTGICLGSGYDLPLRNNSLDLITLFDSIEHIEDDLRVVRQCGAALKPGGHLMITVPAYQFLFADNDRISHHLRRYTRGRLQQIARAAGLEIIKSTYYNVLLFPLILPAILAMKAMQAIRGPLGEGEGKTNLSHHKQGPVNRILTAIFSAERGFLGRISMPFGHSIALIARKPG